MEEESGTLNFYIQDSNGQPQLIKILSCESNNNINNSATVASNNIIKISSLNNSQDNSLDPEELESGSKPVNLSFSNLNDLAQIRQGYDFKSSFLNHSTNRVPRRDFDPLLNTRRDRSERPGKGLRHFSMRVCEKVKQKGRTSYNEVADELVNEYAPVTNGMTVDLQYDHKNIRRRVYDALNVLMAMNIIAKERKEIRWLGLPTNSMQEYIQLEKEKEKRLESVKQKTQKLYDLILQHIAYKNLVERNRAYEQAHGNPLPNSTIHLPFVVVNTDKKTIVDCCISQDKMEYLFRFNDKFIIHDDFTVMKKIGMTVGLEDGTCNESNFEKAKTLVPKSLVDHLVRLVNNVSVEDILHIDKMGMEPYQDTIFLENESNNMFLISESSSPMQEYSDGARSDPEHSDPEAP